MAPAAPLARKDMRPIDCSDTCRAIILAAAIGFIFNVVVISSLLSSIKTCKDMDWTMHG